MLKTARDTGGELFQMELTMQPGGFVAGEHIHPLQDERFEVISGSLTCAPCRLAYPIARGIPRFVDASNYTSNFGFQWNRFARTQLDSANGTTISRDRFTFTA